MAICIPDRLSSRASRGEKRTFALLKKLPDDYIVYYEPKIDNLHPDFVVIAPDLGVIIIEVKGWYLENILPGSNNLKITINDHGLVRQDTHPLEQARNYMWMLARVCEKSPYRSNLLHKDGPYKNKFFFPFCHFVVLSNISQDSILRHKNQNVSEIFKMDNTLFKEELWALENASPEEIRNTLIRFFHPFFEITPFTPEQVKVLRSIINPEIVICEKDAAQYLDLFVLDLKQENNARKIGEGHRIVYGVAGSGKTLILIARSKWLHDRDPNAKILLLCYNVVLSVYLKHALNGYPRINVFHFDGWAIQNGVTRGVKDASTHSLEDDESLGNRLLEHLRQKIGDYRYYDAILVDEAQDFYPVWFLCILEALADPLGGDLLIVCDANQGIRRIGSLSWKSVGIKAQGRTIHSALDLDRNYRNTQEILKLASLFTAENVKNDEDSISTIPVDPSLAIRRGPKPIVIKCRDRADECDRIVYLSKTLLNGTVPFNNISIALHPDEIGILYVKKLFKDRTVFSEFLDRELLHKLRTIVPIPVTWLSENSYSRSKVFENSVKIQTVASAKGLQYRAVFVMWADLFEPHSPGDRDLERQLLYVALTRAADVLIITYSQSSAFIERMIQSGDAIGM